eukprot:10984443-Ditylum_brightwellii.AAC.2
MTHRSFALVNWDAVSNALAGVSSNFNIGASKHITGFCGTAHRLKIHGCCDSGICPNCQRAEERPSHIVQCIHEDFTSHYMKGVNSLIAWLRKVNTNSILIDTINSFLKN